LSTEEPAPKQRPSQGDVAVTKRREGKSKTTLLPVLQEDRNDQEDRNETRLHNIEIPDIRAAHRMVD